VAGGALDRCAIDVRGFRFETLDHVDDPMFVPGAVRYGDIPGLIALSAPRPTLVVGETPTTVAPAPEAWRALGAGKALSLQGSKTETETTRADRIVDWLIEADERP